MSQRRTHVAICGAGMSGLTAALSALESGAHVTIFEKAPEIGGTTALSGGLVWTWADLAEMQNAIPNGNPALQQLLFDQLAAGRDWLGGYGVIFGEEESVFGYGWGQRMEPPQALDRLVHHCLALGATIRCGKALEALTVTNGRITGLTIAHDDGSLEQVQADAVVLATGGFHGNAELLRRYVLDAPSNLYVRANSWNTGDGLIAATNAGAALTPGINTFYGHALCAPPSKFKPLEFREVSQIYGQMAVAINLRGRRFSDESRGSGEEELNQDLSRQPEGSGFYIVDRATSELESRPKRGLVRVIIDRAKWRGAPVVVADTFAELAEGLGRMGVPPLAVMETLETFNSACQSGTAQFLDPPRTGNQTPLLEPPFTAVGVKASITFTMGGIAVDERTRVLRRSATSSPLAQSITEMSEFREVAIPGLFSVGSDVGNVSNRGYAGGLSNAITTGRVAGREAANVLSLVS
jgi:succinate dehydrogenase/fumarate reductase flavoprotein subunit